MEDYGFQSGELEDDAEYIESQPDKTPPTSKTKHLCISAILLIIPLAVGVGSSTQAGINGRLGQTIGSGIYAAFFSFCVGLGLVILMRVIEMITLRQQCCRNRDCYFIHFYQPPRWYQFLGGFFGAFFVASSAFLTPEIGFAWFFVMFVCGQLVCSVVLDHIGFLGTHKRRINWVIVLALVVTIVGAIISVQDDFGNTDSAVGLTILYSIIALCTGIGVPIQATINRTLGKTLKSKFAAATVSFTVGTTLCFLVSIGVSIASPDSFKELDNNIGETEWWMFCGGFFGSLMVVTPIFLVKVIGVAMFFIAIVAGQLASSVLYDAYGFLLEQKDATVLRIVGVGLVFLGMLISKWGNHIARKKMGLPR